MTKKTIDKKDEIKEKLDYLGIDLENVKEQINEFEDLKFRIPKFYDEKQYRQYRFIPIKDIQILLSPTNRMDDLEEKYKKASPLIDYLDNTNEENFLKHTTFLKMLKQVQIDEIEKIEEEEAKLNKKIPFKVKFEGNYLWQIYYSENTNKYFMLVPTEDSDYSTFFFLLKKQLEKKKAGKIFVPVRNVSYQSDYLKKKEYEDIENYLWLFTKDWPLIYEVYDKSNKVSIQIVGETEVYGKIKSSYKIKLNSLVEANQFYKLLKAMFILQTELPRYFEFKTKITKDGSIEFYNNGKKIEYTIISEWINEEYNIGIENIEKINVLIKENKVKLENLKIESATQEIEYLAKEKQISTFLECKKTFFGKFKYYFKYNKKKNKTKSNKNIKEDKEESNETEKEHVEKRIIKTKKNYTIEELIELYKEYEKKENEIKNILMDINALKLKNKNMAKKIENATMFIEEIDSHKRSIFEFWKYSNKDEMATLAEGEKEEVNIIKKITKIFDYKEDLESFGKTMDKVQRKALSKEETDNIYITATNLIDILNKIKNNEVLPKEIETSLKNIKKEAKEEAKLDDIEEFNIFGGISQDATKISKIGNKKHREIAKDKFNILGVNKNTKQVGYKAKLEQVIEIVQKALGKVVVTEDLPVYKAFINEKLNQNNFNVFDINPEIEIENIIKQKENKINLYKVNLKRGVNAISYANIIFYDNQNKTLPLGQDISSNILVDLSKTELVEKEKQEFKILSFENEHDDFSKMAVKTITVYEMDIKEDE